jgi:hypothetical protein
MFQRGWLSSDHIVQPIVPLPEAPAAFLTAYRDPAGAIKLAVRF